MSGGEGLRRWAHEADRGQQSLWRSSLAEKKASVRCRYNTAVRHNENTGKESIETLLGNVQAVLYLQIERRLSILSKKWLEGINRFQVYVPSIAIIDLNDREKSVGCSIMTIIWVKNRLLQES